MPWYRIPATIVLEVEAENDKDARDLANTLLEKRVEQCEFGHEKNDNSRVCSGESELLDDWYKTDDEGNEIDREDDRERNPSGHLKPCECLDCTGRPQ